MCWPGAEKSTDCPKFEKLVYAKFESPELYAAKYELNKILLFSTVIKFEFKAPTPITSV